MISSLNNFMCIPIYQYNLKICFCKPIISHKLFAAVSNVLPDTWLLSRPKADGVWYKKLSQSSKDKNLIENMDIAAGGLSESNCLILSRFSKLDTKLAVNVEECTKKHSVVCRMEPQMINPLTRPGKFPCLPPNHSVRTKRSTDEKEHQKELKGSYH